jgi:hypothetical protein
LDAIRSNYSKTLDAHCGMVHDIGNTDSLKIGQSIDGLPIAMGCFKLNAAFYFDEPFRMPYQR